LPTVNDIINQLTSHLPKIEPTVDTLKFGNLQHEVKGIVTTFMPTFSVLQRTVELGANLIIAHEGAFFSHNDAFESSLQDNRTYLAKKQYILENGLNLFRYHDYPHAERPDLVNEGLLRALEWDPYFKEFANYTDMLVIPGMTVAEIAAYVKAKLGIPYVRIIGDPDMSCTRVGITVGYRGGGSVVIPAMEQNDLDLVICGEGQEWETPEYVRDSVALGRNRALLVLGHAESEQPGMKRLAERLQEEFAEVPVHYVPNEPVFQVL
jgi:putative NIF3 family GTP cyclohydrolase 1 type 2